MVRFLPLRTGRSELLYPAVCAATVAFKYLCLLQLNNQTYKDECDANTPASTENPPSVPKET